MAVEAWRDIRHRPVMWLIISASAIGWLFCSNVIVPNAPANLLMILLVIGFSVCFAITFLFWCMAVYLFDDDVRGKGRRSYRGAYARAMSIGRPAVWSGLLYGFITVLAVSIAQLVVGMLFSTLLGGVSDSGSELALSIILQFLVVIAADLALVLIVLVPQMLCLEGGRKIEEIVKASYYLVKERYWNAFKLIIIPEIVIQIFYAGFLIATQYEQAVGIFFQLRLLVLVVIALVEGAKVVYLAAAFNRFYYQALEEEKKKRRKKSRQKAAKKKKR
jgi:hypothetical protein